MYNVACGSATGAGCTALAVTGFNTMHYIVAAVTLMFFGAMVLRLVPRKES